MIGVGAKCYCDGFGGVNVGSGPSIITLSSVARMMSGMADRLLQTDRFFNRVAVDYPLPFNDEVCVQRNDWIRSRASDD